jgi:hypothetical protein
MTRKEKIKQEVQKTLDFFNQAERINSDPFFYTRLKARIEELDTQPRQLQGWKIVWSILKPALIVCIVALNIMTATMFLKNQTQGYSNREQLLEAFAQESTLDSYQYSPNLLINEWE